MAFDDVQGDVLLFGGYAGAATGDAGTWAWNGQDWSTLVPASAPPTRFAHTLTNDPARHRIVLFGGVNITSAMNDTWEWDGSNWTQRNPSTAPPARGSHVMAFDNGRREMIMLGGSAAANVPLQDAWTWDGQQWQVLGPSVLSARLWSVLTYDTASNGLMTFGGQGVTGWLNDTWVSNHTASFATFGQGCTGSQGLPGLAADSWSLPLLGRPLVVRLSALPRVATVVLPWIGFSNVSGGSYPLPLDLGLYGMPGCLQFADVWQTTFLFAFTGTVDWRIPMPDVPSLIGTSAYLQALVVDPGINLLGATVTNAGAAILGL